jgi:hypothetical protein
MMEIDNYVSFFIMNIPLFPTKLPPTLLCPNGYPPTRPDTEEQIEECVSSPVDDTVSSSVESKPPMHMDVEAVISKDEQKETLTSVVSVSPALPQPKHLLFRNSFQIPFLLIGFGFMYSRGLL